MTAILSQQGVIIPAISLRKILGANFDRLLGRLTLTCPQKIGPNKVAKIYKYSTIANTNCIHLPRFSARVLLNSHILESIDQSLPPPRIIVCPLQHDLFDNQKLIVDHLMQSIYTPENIAAGWASCSLNLRAGMGKTFVAAGLISRLSLRTLYIVPTRPLMSQAVKDLRRCLYDPDAENQAITIGAFERKPGKTDRTRDHHNQDITVIVINSALLMPLSFFAGYSLIVIDEVHAMCSEERREIFWLANARCNFAISATTENRNDGFDPVFHKHMGDVIRAENIEGFTYGDVQFDCHVKIINYKGPPTHVKNLTHLSTGKIFTHYMHGQYIEDPYRLQLAIDELIALYDWSVDGLQHNIYVFAEELDILEKARAAFIKILAGRARNDIVDDIVVPEDDAMMFTGGLKDSQIEQITIRGRVLFTTYGFGGTGLSFPKMSAEIFLTPRRSGFLQIVPRILRRGSDQRIPRVIVDIVDVKTALRWQVGSRMIAYDHYGFQKNEITVKYDQIRCPPDQSSQ